MSSGEAYYRFENVNGCSNITLLPELNDKQWADIERVGSEIVDRISSVPSPRVLVDLTPLSYMGSAMVALIVRIYKTVNSHNGKMVVVNQHELVFEVLKLAGLTKLWTIVKDRQEAYTALGVKGSIGGGSTGAMASGGMGIVAAGIVGTVGALIGLYLQFSGNPHVPRKIALLVEIAFAFLGLVAGMILLNQAGSRRNLGIVFLAICVLAVLGGIVVAPEEAPAQAPAGSNTTAAPVSTTASTTVTTTTTAAPVATTNTTQTAAAPATTTNTPATATADPAMGKGRKKKKD